MSTLSREKIRELASNAGFKGNDLDIAVAVALAESGGNPDAFNGKGKDESYGLWQINMYGDLKKDRLHKFEKFNVFQPMDLLIPRANASAAYEIFRGSGWGAWTTYTSGAYKQFLNGGGTPVPGASHNNNITDALDATKNVVAGPLDNVTNAFNAFGSTFFKATSNLTGVIVALVLIVLGILLLARGAVANVLPAGKALKIARAVTK